MDKTKEEELYNKYEMLFSQVTLPPSKTCMCWGCECENGWYDIIDKACSSLTKLSEESGAIIELAQVKQKFGGLRMYLDIIDDKNIQEEAYKIVEEAESKSFKVCEVCGKPGKIRKKSWIQTLCDEHMESSLKKGK